MHELIVPGTAWQAMRRRVQRCAPLEACGLLAGKDGQVEVVIGVRNAARSPVRYLMEPGAQWRAFNKIEQLGLDLLGIYHSHPNGPQRPSPTDIQEVCYAVVQIIWFPKDGKWRAGGFWIEAGQVSDVTLQLLK